MARAFFVVYFIMVKIVFVVDVANRFDKTLQNLKNRDIQMIIKKIKNTVPNLRINFI